MKFYTTFYLLMIAIGFSGCTSIPEHIGTELRKDINRISVDVLPIKHDPGIYTSEAEIAGLLTFAFVGTAASNAVQAEAAKKPSYLFGLFLQHNNISVQDIVKHELKAQLTDSNLYQLTDRKNADAHITVSVGLYGFGQKSMWSSYQRSQLYLSADVTNKKDEKIAKLKGFATPFRDEKAMTFEEIFMNPDEVKKSFQKSANVAVKDIINSMSSE